MDIYHYDEVTSTMDVMRDLLNEKGNLPEFSIVSTDFQTAGRGQGDHVWVSDKGKNILISMVMYPNFLPVQKQFYLSQVISLGIAEFFTHQCWGNTRVKWPNDVMCCDEKIGGILIEHLVSGSKIEKTIVGIGLNMTQGYYDFKIDEDQWPQPTSAQVVWGGLFDLDDCIINLRKYIIQKYEMLKEGKFEEIRKEYDKILFRRVVCYRPLFFEDANGEFFADIKEVEENGTLVLQLYRSDEIRKYQQGEIKFKKAPLFFNGERVNRYF